MRKAVVGVLINGEFTKAIPYVYDGTQWVHVRPRIYISGWQDVGGAGTLFYRLLEQKEGKNVISSQGDNILVREAVEYDSWIDRDGKIMHVTDHKVTEDTDFQPVLRFALREGDQLFLLDSDHNYLQDSTGKSLLIRR